MEIKDYTWKFRIIFCLFLASLVFFLSEKGAFRRLEYLSHDLYFNIRQHQPANPHIVILEITDADIAKVGRWPWKRSWHALMTRALTDLGAKAIYFDFLFSDPAEPEDDLLFEESIRASKRVFLPFAFESDSPDMAKASYPLPRFSRFAAGVGATNIYPDQDGIMRRIQLIFSSAGQDYQQSALQIAMNYEDLSIKSVTNSFVRLANSRKEVDIPAYNNGKMLINWLGPWKYTFEHYSFLDVLSAYKQYRDGHVPSIDLQKLKGSICLIGVTGIGLPDIKPTPVDPTYPGVGITATIISNIIDRRFLFTPWPAWVLNTLIFFIMCLIPLLVVRGEKTFNETVFILFVTLTYLYGSFQFFKHGYMFSTASHLAGFFITYIALVLYNISRITLEKRMFYKMAVTDGLTGLYNIRYFRILLDTDIALAGPDQTKKFSLVMIDIDNFKTINDMHGHQAGDSAIKDIANVIKSAIRSSDIAARYGGDEMIILLRGSDLSSALNIAEKIRRTVEANPLRVQGVVCAMTTSIGISLYRPGDSLETIIQRADAGLYESKKKGKNAVSAVE